VRNGVPENVCSRRRQRCQFSGGYLGSVNPFDRTARNGRGHCFCFWSPFRPLTSPFATPGHPRPRSSLAFDSRREAGVCEESITELFKFVSNIEISFMPGEFIIEVYRRTRGGEGNPRARDGMRTEVRRREGGGGGELFVFRSTIVSYCPSPSGFLPPPRLRACSFRRRVGRGGGRGGRSEGRGRDGGGGGERERERLRCASRRRRLPFNFARKRKLAGPPRKWAANRKKTVALNGAWFVKSYCLGRGVRRVPKANRSISRIGECAIAVYLRIEAERNG